MRGDIELYLMPFCAQCSYDAKNRVCYRWDFPIGVEKNKVKKSFWASSWLTWKSGRRNFWSFSLYKLKFNIPPHDGSQITTLISLLESRSKKFFFGPEKSCLKELPLSVNSKDITKMFYLKKDPSAWRNVGEKNVFPNWGFLCAQEDFGANWFFEMLEMFCSRDFCDF